MLPTSWPTPDGADSSAKAMGLARIISSLTGDLVVALSGQGRVVGVSCGAASAQAPEALSSRAQAWVRRPWVDTVTPDCRAKARRMMQELRASGWASQREMSHSTDDGHPALRVWTAMQVSEDGTALALGRDPAPLRRQVEHLKAAQDQLEQSYWDSWESRDSRLERDGDGA